MIEPLIHTEAESGSSEFLGEFRGKEYLIYLTSIQTRHTGLHILSIVSLFLTINITVLIVICTLTCTLQIDDRHRSLINHRTARMVVLQSSLPVQAIIKTIVVHQSHLARLV